MLTVCERFCAGMFISIEKNLSPADCNVFLYAGFEVLHLFKQSITIRTCPYRIKNKQQNQLQNSLHINKAATPHLQM